MSGGEQAFKILIALSDDSLKLQLVQRLKKQFVQLPLAIDIAESRKKALAEFKEKRHELLLLSHALPGSAADEMITEIRKIEGGSSVVVLGGAASALKTSGVVHFPLPIVNWTVFLDCVEEAIPDKLKSKFGLAKRDSKLLEKLREYSSKYASADSNMTAEPIVCIPRLFDEVEQSGGKASPASTQNAGAPKKEVHYVELAPEVKRRILKIELSILAGLLAATLLAFLFSEDSGGFFSLRSALALTTGFSFLGFFASQSLERFIYGKETELKN